MTAIPQVPSAAPVRTPAQYGAVAPLGQPWPINQLTPDHYGLNTLYPTIQGEGGQAGTPMVIVRLQGCPVGCVFCDTPESWARVGEGWLTGTQIAAAAAAPRLHWALVTGGEPTWYHLEALTVALHRRDLKTALETAGVYPITGDWDWVTLSPKPAGLLPFDATTLVAADELKWIVGREADVLALEDFLQRYPIASRRVRVSIQPLSASPRATALCLETLMQHPGWRLSLQTHKMLGIA